MRRTALLREVGRDREALVQVARSIHAAAHSVDHARRTLLNSGQVLRALQTASGLLAALVWLRTGRRPPFLLLASLSLQLLHALTRLPLTRPRRTRAA